MPIELDLAVPQLRAVRSAYTHIKVYWSATENGVFAEATGPHTRIPLTDANSYLFVHPARSETEFFRISYWNERTRAESAMGPVVPGLYDPSLEVISVEELKTNYLFGVDLTNDEGDPYPDSLFRWYIRAAVAQLERYLGDVPLRELTITRERSDFFHRDFAKFMFYKTKWAPIISVTEVRLVVPSDPSATRVFPPEWIRFDDVAGQIEIMPGAGSLALPLLSGGGVLLPTLFGVTGYLPHAMEYDYRAGFARGQLPADIRHAVGMLASCGPFNIAGDLIAGAGVASYSIGLDALSQSVSTTSSATNAGYGARIIQYQKDLKTMLPALRNYFVGIRAVAV